MALFPPTGDPNMPPWALGGMPRPPSYPSPSGVGVYPGGAPPSPRPPWGMPGAGFDFKNNELITGIASALLANRGHFPSAMASFGQMAPALMAAQRKRRAMNALLKRMSGKGVSAEEAQLMADAGMGDEYVAKMLLRPTYSTETDPDGTMFQIESGTGKRTVLKAPKLPATGKDIQNYGFYKTQEEAAGRTPKPFGEWMTSTGSSGATGQTERMIAAIREENPSLSYAEALKLTQRAPTAGGDILRREGLALGAAKEDPDFDIDPSAALDKWRNYYGLRGTPPVAAAEAERGSGSTSSAYPESGVIGGSGRARPATDPDFYFGAPAGMPRSSPQPARAPAGAAPVRPRNVPQGSAYSPSARMWRTPDGRIFDANGNSVAGQ